jgi:uncharacterized repeat protein (TIGR03987 family)
MKPILLLGSIIVSLALIAYSIGVISEQRTKVITWRTLVFLSTGLGLDITGTICMLLGSVNSPFTYHGFLGYSALLAMFMDTLLMWRLKYNSGILASVPSTLHKYSLTAYAWWVFVYVSGLLIAMNK